MRLILFDIDGTLLDCGPQVRPILGSALTEVFGTSGAVDTYDFAGRTDPRIILDLLGPVGIAEDELRERLPEIRARYVARLEERLDRQGMRLLPGVAEALEHLAGRDDVALGLVTGNWEPGARTKLSRFDLNRYFDFGAFGCDATDRSDLPPFALDRAERRLGRRFRPEERHRGQHHPRRDLRPGPRHSGAGGGHGTDHHGNPARGGSRLGGRRSDGIQRLVVLF